jgi:hypothetical protein
MARMGSPSTPPILTSIPEWKWFGRISLKFPESRFLFPGLTGKRYSWAFRRNGTNKNNMRRYLLDFKIQ